MCLTACNPLQNCDPESFLLLSRFLFLRYFAVRSWRQRSLSSSRSISLQIHLRRTASLRSLVFTTAKPSKIFWYAQLIPSHHMIFIINSSSSPKELRSDSVHLVVILLTQPAHPHSVYIEMLLREELVRVSLPPEDKFFPFQGESFLLIAKEYSYTLCKSIRELTR